jgi:hypothetical protein
MPHRRLLLLPLLVLVPLLPLCGADEEGRRRALAKLRAADRPAYARLRQQAAAFLALPTDRREQLLRLDRDLHALKPADREHLTGVMRRYADWLAGLPEAERRRVQETRDRAARLALVRHLREQEWLRAQPKKTQERLEKLRKARGLAALTRILGQFASPRNVAPLAGAAALLAPRPEPTVDLIAKLKQDERQRRLDWHIAARHWGNLVEHPPKDGMPNRASHFGKDVDDYVKKYLIHLVSEEEWKRLKAAEGTWPQYPYLLVELADQHPLALPGPRHIDTVAKLPADVHARLALGFKGTAKKAEVLLHNRLKKFERSPDFGTAVAELANQKNLTLPVELFPTRPEQLSPQTRTFVNDKLKPLLTRDELADLKGKENRWPDYPRKIQELADRHHLRPPWLTLPGERERWDPYRRRR